MTDYTNMNRLTALQERVALFFGSGSPQSTRTSVALLVLASVLSITSFCVTTAAEETVYDNTHLSHNSELFFPGPPPDFFDLIAQPFQLGENNTVSSVSLRLGRWDGTEHLVSGPMRFSIWDDDGNGLPGQHVGQLGMVDVTTLTNFKPNAPNVLETVVLDSPVTGLAPNETYYVVGDTRELDGLSDDSNVMRRDSVMMPFLSRSAGTNGAGVLLISHDEAAINWESIQPFAGRRFLQMDITATTTVGTNTVFDNVDFEPFEANTPLDTDRRFAQQFFMDDSRTVDSLTVKLRRLGSVTGSMSFELWSNSESNDPLEQIPGGELGVVSDVGQIPTGNTDFSFHSPVSGLSPNEAYWVVANFAGITSTLSDIDTIAWPIVITNDGANGAASAHGSTNEGVSWLDYTDIFPPDNPGILDHILHQMAVSTVRVLQAGDTDQDFDFDQLDLVQVQIAAKYLTGQAATWGEGDWDGAPGGSPGSPPAGDGLFNQTDIIAAQLGDIYLTGPYATVQAGGTTGDGQTSVIYNAGTGEVAVDAPAGVELTSINIDSASGIFTGEAAANLGGSFDNDADNNIFKATFGSSFSSISFGNVAQAGLAEQFLLDDLTAIGSLAGGGDLGNVDLVYVPEPASALLLAVGLVIGLTCIRRGKH